MLRLLCTTSALRLRAAFAIGNAGGPQGARRVSRTMAVPSRPTGVPMAVPFEAAAPSRAAQLVAAGALALALAGLWRQDSVIAVTRIALDGLRDSRAYAVHVDAADVPAMDPGLARVLDPRTRAGSTVALRAGTRAIQPFGYVVREGETLQEIATRFGTDVSALLWNNGLDSVDQVGPGARLTVLPVQGVLHLVKVDETLAQIAERYGSRLDDLILANALDRPGRIAEGQVIVVAGGKVPMPIALTDQNSQGVALNGSEIVADLAPGSLTASGNLASESESRLERPEDLPRPTDASSWQSEFILSVAPGARASQRKSGVPASVTLAQAILESDWGRSKLTREANNLFGIKAFRGGGTAGVYEINTWEVYGGQSVTVFAAFKAYSTLADSIADHGTWFHDNDRYHRALDVKHDPRAFAYAINAAGYATDPAYAPKLIALMERFGLFAYDVPADE